MVEIAHRSKFWKKFMILMQIWALNDGFEYKEWCLLSASMKIFQTLSSLAKFVWLDTITYINFWEN